MSVVTRINLATNPEAASATNYAVVAGTGGTANLTHNSGISYSGTGYEMVTWTVATTAVSGGVSYTQAGLNATTQYSHQMWCLSSITQKMFLSAQYRDSSHANVGAAAAGATVSLTAGVWTQLTVTATSGVAVTEVVLTAAATTGGSVWTVNATLGVEAVCIETAAAPGTYFDGSFLDGLSIVYDWMGTADASPSSAVIYTPSITPVVDTSPPTDRIVVTVADLAPGDSTVNLWRTVDGRRATLAGGKHWTVNGSNAITDYMPALGRDVTYDLEVLDGISAGVATPTATANIAAAHGWIQDPLVPSTAVPLYGDVGPDGEAGLDDSAVKNIEFNASITMLEIQGSPDPIALIGQRQSGSNISFDMTTDSTVHAADLLALINQAAPLLIRTLPEWSGALPGLCYLAIPKQAQLPQNEAWGGTVIHWSLNGDLVAAPTSNVLVDLYTYGVVAGMWTTYQQAQTTLSGLGRTYLDVLKSPSGA